MGFFSRLREAVSSTFGFGGKERAEVDFGNDTLNDIWENSTHDVPPSALASFSDEGADYFRTGWVDSDVDSEERIAAREAFMGMLEDYDLTDIADFDWDAWRDWYTSS